MRLNEHQKVAFLCIKKNNKKTRLCQNILAKSAIQLGWIIPKLLATTGDTFNAFFGRLTHQLCSRSCKPLMAAFYLTPTYTSLIRMNAHLRQMVFPALKYLLIGLNCLKTVCFFRVLLRTFPSRIIAWHSKRAVHIHAPSWQRRPSWRNSWSVPSFRKIVALSRRRRTSETCSK